MHQRSSAMKHTHTPAATPRAALWRPLAVVLWGALALSCHGAGHPSAQPSVPPTPASIDASTPSRPSTAGTSPHTRTLRRGEGGDSAEVDAARVTPEAPGPDAAPSPQGDTGRDAAAAADPDDLSGPPRHLSVPKGSLARFKRAARKGGDTLVAVQYGDSHSMDGSLANALRERFSHGAQPPPAFVTPSHSARWNANIKRHGKWTRQNWLRKADQGSFGPMGLAWVTEDRDARWTLKLEDGGAPSGTTLTVLYARQAGHMPLAVFANGKRLARVKSARRPRQGLKLGRMHVKLPAGVDEVELAVDCRRCRRGAQVRVFGMLVETPDSEVSWDNFGITSTAVRSLYERADHVVGDYLKWRDPDLLLIWYGANSVPARERRFDLKRYTDKYRTVLKMLRDGAPKASCLVVGPPDMAYFPEKTCFMNRAERRIANKKRKSRQDRLRLRENRLARACDPDSLIKKRGRRVVEYPGPNVHGPRKWRAYKERCQPYSPPLLPDMIAAQKRVAAELGCAYFDSYAAMGGADTIQTWTCEAQQPRASSDLVHMTRKGYETIANLLTHDLTRADAL